MSLDVGGCWRRKIKVLFGIQNTRSPLCLLVWFSWKPSGQGLYLLSVWGPLALAGTWSPTALWRWCLKHSFCCLVDSLGHYFRFSLPFSLVAAQGVWGPAPAVRCLGPRWLARRFLPNVWRLIKLQCKCPVSLSNLNRFYLEGTASAISAFGLLFAITTSHLGLKRGLSSELLFFSLPDSRQMEWCCSCWLVGLLYYGQVQLRVYHYKHFKCSIQEHSVHPLCYTTISSTHFLTFFIIQHRYSITIEQ